MRSLTDFLIAHTMLRQTYLALLHFLLFLSSCATASQEVIDELQAAAQPPALEEQVCSTTDGTCVGMPPALEDE